VRGEGEGVGEVVETRGDGGRGRAVGRVTVGRREPHGCALFVLVLLAVLDPPVLEPNLDLSFCEVELLGQVDAVASNLVLHHCKLPLQSVQLLCCEDGPDSFAFRCLSAGSVRFFGVAYVAGSLGGCIWIRFTAEGRGSVWGRLGGERLRPVT